jgi:lactate dehydrogenase-like 2-hydroxyacid dehydrogenase
LKFPHIACIDDIDLTPETYRRLEEISAGQFKHCDADPASPQEIIAQLSDADCALVSWRTRVDEGIMRQCPSLQYIGLCASRYSNEDQSNVDIKAARRPGITVTAVGQYGDEATAEFIFCLLLNLCRGLEKAQWQKIPCELHQKKLGIIGLGAVGENVLRLALGFGMEVAYFSRRHKPNCELLGATYLRKTELLRWSDILSLHVPKGTLILSAEDFAEMQAQAVLVNTCLGTVFAAEDFEAWIKNSSHFAIMDASVDAAYLRFRELPNVIYRSVIAGQTAESRRRLSAQVLSNLEAFLAGNPKNVIN